MNHTQNYQLSQWEATDKVQRTDFNADNAKIDGAIKAVDTLARSKADSSALTALSQTVSAYESALNQKGNCKLCFKTYTGTGTYGGTSPTVLTFPGKPLLVIISHIDGSYTMMTVRGDRFAICRDITSAFSVNASWSGNSVSIYSSQAASVQMNGEGAPYAAIALIDAGA